jgi:hypothetical protein
VPKAVPEREEDVIAYETTLEQLENTLNSLSLQELHLRSYQGEWTAKAVETERTGDRVISTEYSEKGSSLAYAVMALVRNVHQSKLMRRAYQQRQAELRYREDVQYERRIFHGLLRATLAMPAGVGQLDPDKKRELEQLADRLKEQLGE